MLEEIYSLMSFIHILALFLNHFFNTQRIMLTTLSRNSKLQEILKMTFKIIVDPPKSLKPRNGLQMTLNPQHDLQNYLKSYKLPSKSFLIFKNTGVKMDV